MEQPTKKGKGFGEVLGIQPSSIIKDSYFQDNV
jgi:hypothetical protein